MAALAPSGFFSFIAYVSTPGPEKRQPASFFAALANMPIFPTWNISYTGPFLPRSLPLHPLHPALGCGYRSSSAGVRSGAGCSPCFTPANPSQQGHQARNPGWDRGPGAAGQGVQPRSKPARRTADRKQEEGAGWLVPDHCVGLQKAWQCCREKRKGWRTGEETWLQPCCPPCRQSRVSVSLPRPIPAAPDPGNGYADCSSSEDLHQSSPPSQRGRSGRLIVSFIPL